MSTWFRNLTLMRLGAFPYSAEQLSAALARQAFLPCTSLCRTSEGWVPPVDGADLVRSVNGQLLIALRTEKKLLPASVVNAAAKIKAAEIEEQQGYKVGRKQMKELKEVITDELLGKAFTTSTDTRVWIDPVNGWLVIDAASPAKADMVRGLLFKSLDPLNAVPLKVETSPVAAMTEWLATDTAPAGFTIDQDLELQSSSEKRATVRYASHPLDVADMGRHIAAGKRCTKLAMTWNDRLSFVLNDQLAIKRLTPLDVLKEQADGTLHDEQERFDADFLLMAGGLSEMLAALVDALGGERRPNPDRDPNTIDMFKQDTMPTKEAA